MTLSSWEKWDNYEREKWRRDLRDINCWLNAYHKVLYNNTFFYKEESSQVFWIFWAGPMGSFSQVISAIHSERINRICGPYEHVIKVDLKPTPTAGEAQGRGITSIKYQLALAAAKDLGLLDQKYNRLKEKLDRIEYYTYGCFPIISSWCSEELVRHMRHVICPLIGKQLSDKKYLLVVDNLRWPIELGTLTRDCGLPPPMWKESLWIIFPTSQDAYNKSKSEDDGGIYIHRYEDIMVLISFAMRQSAEHIFNTIRQESTEYWHAIVVDCFHYAMAVFAKHSGMESISEDEAITSDELIHQWASILPRMIVKEEACNTISTSKCSSMRRFGRVILEAFQKYFLLTLPFSPANEAPQAMTTAAQFLRYHDLVVESITLDELSDNKKKWVSFIGDNGWHVSPKWLLSQEEETRGTTALFLRGCSQQSLILSKLNHFLPNVCFLRVLDLSYTPLKSLPSSLSCLQNLRLLSLRGCHHLKTLFISSATSGTDSTENTSSPLSTLYQLEILVTNGVAFSHLTQDVANRKSNLIYLDMSHSEITMFPPNFFQDMSNLEELILVNCSNLVELPPSMVALSNLSTLEITGTQIRYFPHKIFEEMHKLQSLKLIDNSNLISITRPISRVHEIELEGHPNLKFFSLIGTTHIQRLSLRGCKKLKSVELKNLGALEELDLSGTFIDDLPANIPNGQHLRRLILLGVPSLLRFPWHMLERFPHVFCLDQCEEGVVNQFNQVSHVCVSDPMFFYTFRESCEGLVRAGQIFQSFYVRVTQCSKNITRRKREEEMVDSKLHEMVQNHSIYLDVHSSYYANEIAIGSPITAPLHQTERHVEITGTQHPSENSEGLSGLLNVTKSISVICYADVRALSDWSYFEDLEECELRRCHKMTRVYQYSSGMRSLRNLHVCNLKSLVWFCSKENHFAFSSLKHLHLEYCAKLEAMMPYSVTVPCLETIDIVFCYKLKKIFYEGLYNGNTSQLLPKLQRVRLQELPLLKHFHKNDATIIAPAWKELHIRGCWSLRCLPHLQDQLEKVKVNGERSWWSKVQWSSPSHYNSYEPRLPPKFASFDEHTEVTSYLR